MPNETITILDERDKITGTPGQFVVIGDNGSSMAKTMDVLYTKDKITGTPGQFVVIDDDGNAVAKTIKFATEVDF